MTTDSLAKDPKYRKGYGAGRKYNTQTITQLRMEVNSLKDDRALTMFNSTLAALLQSGDGWRYGIKTPADAVEIANGFVIEAKKQGII